MRKLLSFILALAVTLSLWAQDSSRGVHIIKKEKESTGTTRALVVGISDYQHLPSLAYADKDAIEFAYFLTHNQAWQIPENNVRLLTNDKARAGDIITWLNWLLQHSNAGDNVVFYFSGHGDVETTGDAGKGYLLAWDSPKNNYVTGAVSIDLLRQAYTEMIDKGVKVYIVTDACRAGHLAGGAAGVKTTAEAFSKQWRNEVKILSAQPDELSYEGSQWGGGRGVFSFFLTKGLNGYADMNMDSMVTLAELEMYVGLQVSQETSYKQQPVFEGANKYTNRVAKSDSEGISRYSQYKSGDIAIFVVKEKGNELDAGDCKALFEQFAKQLDNIASSDARNQAWKTYLDILMCSVQEEINSGIDRNLADIAGYQLNAALLNHVQQVMNQTLIGKKLVGKLELDEVIGIIDWIKEINRDKKIANADHLENMRRYFVINREIFWNEGITVERDNELRRMLNTALAVEPGAAYLELTKGIFFSKDEEYDSALFYYTKAIEHSPTWLMAYYYAGLVTEYKNEPVKAIAYFQKALSLDSSYRTFECAECFYFELGELFQQQEQNDSAAFYYSKAAVTYNSPAVFSLIEIFHQGKKIKERNKWLQVLKDGSRSVKEQLDLLSLQMELKLVKQKAAKQRLDSLEVVAPDDDKAYAAYVGAEWCRHFGRDPLYYAENAYLHEPNDFTYINGYVEALINNTMFDEAETVIQGVNTKLNRTQQASLRNALATCYAYTGREQQAFNLYRNLIDEGWLQCKDIKGMKPLRKLPDYLSFTKNCK